jgi:hypothetical protein
VKDGSFDTGPPYNSSICGSCLTALGPACIRRVIVPGGDAKFPRKADLYIGHRDDLVGFRALPGDVAESVGLGAYAELYVRLGAHQSPFTLMVGG